MARRVQVFGEIPRRVRVKDFLVPVQAQAQEGRHLVVVYLDDPPPMSPWNDEWGWNVSGGGALDQYLLPKTPVLDSLAATGVRFRNSWNTPVCSPGRASMLTGRYTFEHGVGIVVREDHTGTLGEFADPGFGYTTWCQLLEVAGVRTGFVGKLHLSLDPSETNTATGQSGRGYEVLTSIAPGWSETKQGNLLTTPEPALDTTSPNAIASNLNGHYRYTVLPNDSARTEQWTTFVDYVDTTGDPEVSSEYSTVREFEAAKEFVQSVDLAGGERFCLLVSTSVTHSPFDFAPGGLIATQAYRSDDSTLSNNSATKRIWGQVEALDNLLGEFRDWLIAYDAEAASRTSYLVVADNGVDQTFMDHLYSVLGMDPGGSYAAVHALNASDPGGRYKGSTFQMGTWMQMLFSGPDVAVEGSWTDAVVCVPDIHATILDYFGAPAASSGVSFFPVVRGFATAGTHTRQDAYVSYYAPNGNPSSVGTAPSWDPLVSYTDGARVHNRGRIYQWVGPGASTPGDEPLNEPMLSTLSLGANTWGTVGFHFERMVSRLEGIATASGVLKEGYFALLRSIGPDTAPVQDEVYHLSALNGTHVDWLELVPLDILGEYAPHYAELRARIGNLKSSTGGDSSLELGLRFADGSTGVMGVNSSGNVPTNNSETVVVDGAVPLRFADGTGGELVLGGGSTVYQLPVEDEAGVLSGMPTAPGGGSLDLALAGGGTSVVETPLHTLTLRDAGGGTGTLVMPETVGGGGGASTVAVVRDASGVDGSLVKNLSGDFTLVLSSGVSDALSVNADDTVTVTDEFGASRSLELV